EILAGSNPCLSAHALTSCLLCSSNAAAPGMLCTASPRPASDDNAALASPAASDDCTACTCLSAAGDDSTTEPSPVSACEATLERSATETVLKSGIFNSTLAALANDSAAFTA